MKKVLVLGVGRRTTEAIVNQIREVIQGYAIVEGQSISELNTAELNHDVIIDITRSFNKRIGKEIKSRVIPAQRVVNYKYIKELIFLPNGTEVMLVNDTENNAYATIANLKDIGIDHIVFHPVYPNATNYKILSIAVTPGESQLVPLGVERIIDIQPRVLDISTISRLVDMLGVEKQIVGNLSDEYIRDIIEITKSIESARKQASESELLLSKVLDAVNTGIIYVDRYGKILRYNIKSLLMLDVKNIKNESVYNYLDIQKLERQEKIMRINNKEIFLKVEPVDIMEKREFIISFDYTKNIFETDQKIRKNIVSSIVSDLYSFDNFITNNKKMLKIIENAKRFSKTDATILIEGENGTGKEIIAQGIHRSSNRKDRNFVPVNIAAISPSLLESELFGYEDGAFTGAKKGGKIGLFELANGGTLFIDEIGDMPINLQVKLLRVLQEMKIRRIGGVEEIPIDVRVIAATNKIITDLINKGSFRIDLYYRLNVLPIKVPPLRKRKDDILLLLDSYIKKRNKDISVKDVLDENAFKFIQEYRWPGNVRELVNFTQFIMLIYSKEKLSIESLPYYMLENYKNDKLQISLNEEQYWVLEQIAQNEGIGRGNLSKFAAESGMSLGEGMIRRILSELKDKELICSMGNKRGHQITIKGKSIL